MPGNYLKSTTINASLTHFFANISFARVFCREWATTDPRRFDDRGKQEKNDRRLDANDRKSRESPPLGNETRNRRRRERGGKRDEMAKEEDQPKERARTDPRIRPRYIQPIASDVISPANRASFYHIITRKMAHYYHYYFIFSALHRGSETIEKQKVHEININKSSEQGRGS